MKTTPNPKATKKRRGEELFPPLPVPAPVLLGVGVGVGVISVMGVTVDEIEGTCVGNTDVDPAGSLGRGVLSTAVACLTNIRAPSSRALLMNVILPETK